MNEHEIFFEKITLLETAISNIKTSDYVDNLKIALFFTYIDMMAKSVYGNDKGNRARITKLIEEHFQWPYSNYVSLQMLLLRLENTDDPNDNNIMEYLKKQLSSFPKSSPVPLNFDKPIEEIHALWETDNEEKKNRFLEKCAHKNLLYAYRNKIIHEMRPPGDQYMLFETKTPHYVSNIKTGFNECGKLIQTGQVWQLVYPLSFFEDMSKSIRLSIENFCKENEYNPYTHFTFKDLWF